MTYEEDCYVVESGIIISPHLQLDPVEPPEEIVIIPPITECYVENPYRYAGYEYLENVELYDLNARYYDPNTARFLSEYPYNPSIKWQTVKQQVKICSILWIDMGISLPAFVIFTENKIFTWIKNT